MHLARRNLLQEKLRFTLSVAGIALSLMLILVLNGLLSGLYRQVGGYLDHAPGSVVVAQAGITNLLAATSLLPPGSPTSVCEVDGVAQVVPILSQFVILDLHGRKQPVYLVGYHPGLGGGPWKLREGREPWTDSEVVFDRVLARRHKIGLGDSITIMGQSFTVTGLSEGTTSWMTSFVFIRKSAAETLLRAPGATSFLLVTPRDGLTPATLRDRLRAIPGTEVLLKREVIANDVRLLARVFSTPLRLMVGVAFLIGTLVVGSVIYTATLERQREYGVLKAIGVRNRFLYRLVVEQALMAAGAGAAVGMGLAFATGLLIMGVRPQFLVVFEPSAIVLALLAGLAMALAAALYPVRVIAGLAPADVFQRQ